MWFACIVFLISGQILHNFYWNKSCFGWHSWLNFKQNDVYIQEDVAWARFLGQNQAVKTKPFKKKKKEIIPWNKIYFFTCCSGLISGKVVAIYFVLQYQFCARYGALQIYNSCLLAKMVNYTTTFLVKLMTVWQDYHIDNWHFQHNKAIDNNIDKH